MSAVRLGRGWINGGAQLFGFSFVDLCVDSSFEVWRVSSGPQSRPSMYSLNVTSRREWRDAFKVKWKLNRMKGMLIEWEKDETHVSFACARWLSEAVDTFTSAFLGVFRGAVFESLRKSSNCLRELLGHRDFVAEILELLIRKRVELS